MSAAAPRAIEDPGGGTSAGATAPVGVHLDGGRAGGGLSALGWGGPFVALFAEHAAPGVEPGRVVATHRETAIVRTAAGEVAGHVSGRFRREALGPADFPAVGDWVALEPRLAERSGTIHAVLPRRSAIARTAADSNRRSRARLSDGQVLAANVDVAFVMAAVDRPPNLARLERYVALGWGSGATPVVILNKADTCPDLDSAVTAVAAIAPGVDVLGISALTGQGVDLVRNCLAAGRTAVVLGPSGVGKSTLANALLGWDRQATAAVREDDARGRHTTTHRELLPLPNGGLLVDTPGIRSLELLDDDGIDLAFADVEEIATECRFADCSHGREPGCAVREALAGGALDRRRWASYEKLRREAAHHAREGDRLAQEAERRRWRAISRASSEHMRRKYGEPGR